MRKDLKKEADLRQDGCSGSEGNNNNQGPASCIFNEASLPSRDGETTCRAKPQRGLRGARASITGLEAGGRGPSNLWFKLFLAHFKLCRRWEPSPEPTAQSGGRGACAFSVTSAGRRAEGGGLPVSRMARTQGCALGPQGQLCSPFGRRRCLTPSVPPPPPCAAPPTSHPSPSSSREPVAFCLPPEGRVLNPDSRLG